MNFRQPRRRKVELQQVAATADQKHAGSGREADGLAVDENVAGRDGRMTAKVDLRRGREPAQVIVGVVALARDGEGRFAEIILRGDRLHRRVVEPAVERHHRRRIAGQWTLGERVDLEKGDARQCACSVMACGSSVSRSVCPSGSTWIKISVSGKRSRNCCSAWSSRSWASRTV